MRRCRHAAGARSLLATSSRNAGDGFPRASSRDVPKIVSHRMVVYASRGPSWKYVEPGLPTFIEMSESGARKFATKVR